MMRFTARTTRGGGQTFERALIEASRPALRSASEECGKRAQQNIVNVIGTIYGQRRGKKRSEPLADTARYPYRVDSSQYGVSLIFKIEGSAAFKAKFGALNFGAGPHIIAPVNANALSNPQDNFFSRSPVMWSTSTGKFGTHFYEEGIQSALDDFASMI